MKLAFKGQEIKIQRSAQRVFLETARNFVQQLFPVLRPGCLVTESFRGGRWSLSLHSRPERKDKTQTKKVSRVESARLRALRKILPPPRA